jgi:hypothetical protein
MSAIQVEEEVQEYGSGSPDQEWLARGRELEREDGLSQLAVTKRQFAIGDWIAEGFDKWSHDAYDDAAAIFTKYSRESLRNLAFVARRVRTSSRNDVLPWAYHAAVARFKDEPERQMELLAEAAVLELPLQKFRSHIGKKYPPQRHGKAASLTLKLPDATIKMLRRLALVWDDGVEGTALRLVERALAELPDVRQALEDLPETEAA